jgi:hypothetical protein
VGVVALEAPEWQEQRPGGLRAAAAHGLASSLAAGSYQDLLSGSLIEKWVPGVGRFVSISI